MFEGNGKHWLRQLFEAAVDQGRDYLLRSDEQKFEDAVISGRHRQVRRLILSKRVEIDYRSPSLYSQTPLMMAVQWGAIYGGDNRNHRKIISFLLAHGADTSAVDDMGRNVWDLADCNKEILALLPPAPPRSIANQADPVID